MTRHRGARKAAAVLGRWLVPVLALTLLGGWAGSVLASQVPTRYTAETVLVVPPISIGQPGLGAPNDAARLAQTYVAALSAGQQLRAVLVETTGADPEDLRRSLSASIDDGTSVVRISYAGATEDEVLTVLAATTAIVTGPAPPAPVQVGTLQTLSTPAEAVVTGLEERTGVLAGALGGLLAGAFAAWTAERSRPRSDVVEDLAGVLPVPVSDWRRPARRSVEQLVGRWLGPRTGSEAHLLLLGAGRVPRSALEQLAGLVAEAAPDGDGSLAVSTARVGQRTADGAVRDADLVVVVVRRGTLVSRVEDVLAGLGELGVRPAWVLLAPARAQLPVAPVRVAEAQPELARS